MATQHPEHYVVITSWGPKESRALRDLPEMLQNSAGMKGPYQFVLWDWTVSKSHSDSSLKERMTRPIDFRVRNLQLFLRQQPYRNADEHSDPEITLVAHGRSCRAVKQYLCELVQDTHDDWRDRIRIRQAVFAGERKPRRFLVMLWTTLCLALLTIASFLWMKLHREAPPI